MATITPTLTITSTDLFPDESLSISLTDSLTVLGPATTKRMTIASGETELVEDQTILANGSYTKSYVLLYNTSTATSGEIITVGNASNDGSGDDALDSADLNIAPGEFAFFPWNSTVDLVADASSGNPVLEIRIFQQAAG
tara:strand:- start:25 stop:444 length:420 start_codon:yes stop_codon:yes gene_type:complete